MGLYLCIFDGDDELDGVEVGAYADFGALRDAIQDHLEGGKPGARFPVFMRHSDCDGEWTPAEAALLQVELATIADELSRLPPAPLGEGWQRSVARSLGLVPKNLCECFFDVDGEPLLERLSGLCKRAVQRGLPILFQ